MYGNLSIGAVEVENSLFRLSAIVKSILEGQTGIKIEYIDVNEYSGWVTLGGRIQYERDSMNTIQSVNGSGADMTQAIASLQFNRLTLTQPKSMNVYTAERWRHAHDRAMRKN